MNVNNEHLTISEAEALCRAYMDCRLSRQEELELEYVLCSTDLHSELIDDVRLMMTAARRTGAHSGADHRNGSRRHPSRKRLWYGAAACVAVALSVGIGMMIGGGQGSEPVYIAYSSGKRLSGEEAKRECLAELDQYNRIINEMKVEMAEAKREMQGLELLKNNSK